MQNSDFWTRITYLYGSQTSPVILCMQYSMISTRITCLYGSQHLSVVFAFKTATFGEELQVSMCHSSHLWFLHTQQRILDQNFKSVGSQTSSVVLNTHNCVLNTRIKRLYVFQPSPVVLCMQNSDFSTWIASLYGSQPSSVVFAWKTATFGPE